MEVDVDSSHLRTYLPWHHNGSLTMLARLAGKVISYAGSRLGIG